MREIRIRFKLKKKGSRAGAYVEPRTKRWKRFKLPHYWRITLTYGFYACTNDESEYIKCINHEVMHGVLFEIDGYAAWHGWDNIVKSEYNKTYGWKNIVGLYLFHAYCDED